MVLAAKYSPRSLDYTDEDLAQLDKALQISFEFRDWFISEFGGVNCPDVLFKLFGFSTEWKNREQWMELRKIQKELGFTCDLVVEKASVMTAEILRKYPDS